MRTCALVGNDGSIDWLPWPELESDTVFAAILDARRGGHFAIRPAGEWQSRQAYIDGTNVLQTHFETPTGRATLTDCLPVSAAAPRSELLLRRMQCTDGAVRFSVDFAPRFDFGRRAADIAPHGSGLVARDGSVRLFLDSCTPLQFDTATGLATLELPAGRSCWTAVSFDQPQDFSPGLCEERLRATVEFWQEWSVGCAQGVAVAEAKWHPMLVRSALVLKLLTHHATGALAAAATCSLPEQIGGERNWDYRYAWVRDSSFTIQALYNLGRAEEGHAFFTWLRRTCQRHGDPADMRLMYGLKGNPVPPERLLEHLEGYRGSNPVRVGNAAAHQQQHDIYGECVNAYHSLVSDGSHIAADEWQFVSALVDHACRIWREPDSGIWEVRTAPRHFVHSKLMCWVAADRGARMAAQRGDKAAAGRWQQEADAIKAAILSDGFSQRRNSFRQCFGADDLDASTLLIPVLGLVAGDSPQMLGTLDAVGRELRHGPFLLRYVSDDGVRGGEGCFILCSFWLVQALAAAGRVDEAEELLDQVVGFASPLGLLSEEIAPHSHELLGNFPQAFSHVGIISSIIAIGRAKGKPVSGEQDVQVSRQPRQTKAH